jgi:predicted NodU family carbamoyl transferase
MEHCKRMLEDNKRGKVEESQYVTQRSMVLVVTNATKIYATSEERKQRNRQAQAAFRERRTEYIKQLEETIRVHETNLHNLQTAHRSAADECLMLRYKNSLLERILLEKGLLDDCSVCSIINSHFRDRRPRRATSKDWKSASRSYAHATEYGTGTNWPESHHE